MSSLQNMLQLRKRISTSFSLQQRIKELSPLYKLRREFDAYDNPMVEIIRQYKWPAAYMEMMDSAVQFYKTMHTLKGQYEPIHWLTGFIKQQESMMQRIASPAGNVLVPEIRPVLEKYSGKVTEFINKLNEDEVTEENVDEANALLAVMLPAIAEGFKKAARSPQAVLGFWLSIIGLIYPLLMQMVQEAPATQKDIQQLEKRLVQVETNQQQLPQTVSKILLDTFSHTSDAFVVRQKTAVRLKPKNRSFFVGTASEGAIVHVLVFQHQWVYIAFIGTDGLPVSGWLPKKRLKRLE